MAENPRHQNGNGDDGRMGHFPNEGVETQHHMHEFKEHSKAINWYITFMHMVELRGSKL